MHLKVESSFSSVLSQRMRNFPEAAALPCPALPSLLVSAAGSLPGLGTDFSMGAGACEAPPPLPLVLWVGNGRSSEDG